MSSLVSATTLIRDHKQSAEYALAILLDVYRWRPDLHNAFPEVKDGEYSQLIEWALNVSTRRWEDTDSRTLGPYAKWYSTLSDQGTNRERNQAIAERDRAIAEREKTQELLLEAEARLCREETARIAMQCSLSWRVTEPIRRLMNALRSGPRKSG